MAWLRVLMHLVAHPHKAVPFLRWLRNVHAHRRHPDPEYEAWLAKEREEIRVLLDSLDEGEGAVWQLAEADSAGREIAQW